MNGESKRWEFRLYTRKTDEAEGRRRWGDRGRLENRRVAGDPYRMTITETQAQSPLFPLLPSVQILFAAFCCASIRSGSGGAAISTPIGRHTDIGRCIWLHHLNLEHDEVEDDGEPESRREPYRMTITETRPQSPLFPLLPSVQILFCCLLLCIVRAFKSARASFCRLR